MSVIHTQRGTGCLEVALQYHDDPHALVGGQNVCVHGDGHDHDHHGYVLHHGQGQEHRSGIHSLPASETQHNMVKYIINSF